MRQVEYDGAGGSWNARPRSDDGNQALRVCKKPIPVLKVAHPADCWLILSEAHRPY
jgi:hypothetical protein